MSLPDIKNTVVEAKTAGKGFIHGLMLLNPLLIASSFPVGATITHALPPAVLNKKLNFR